MAQTHGMVVDETRDDRGLQTPHVELAYSNSGISASGLAPNEILVCRLLRLPFTGFERAYGVGHQN